MREHHFQGIRIISNEMRISCTERFLAALEMTGKAQTKSVFISGKQSEIWN